MRISADNYRPSDIHAWQGRQDSLASERYFQQIKCIDLLNDTPPAHGTDPVIIGFCSDEGVRRNLGRIGASQGPQQLRRYVGNLACITSQTYIDLGDIHCVNGDLEAAQQQLEQIINWCHSNGHKTILFGGGHEIAWGHFSGLTHSYPNLGIINIDAHFDLRPLLKNDTGSSGTPFLQIAELCRSQSKPFNYCCFGINELANTTSLFEKATTLNVKFLTVEELNHLSPADHIKWLDTFLKDQDKIYLSICLDAFAEAFAPGVSAPQPIGLTPWQVIPLLKYIVQTGKVVSIDIAELSPPLDEHDKTARLAAMLVAKIMEIM